MGAVREKRENCCSVILEQMRKDRFNGQVGSLALDRSTHSLGEIEEKELLLQVQM